MEYGSRLTQNPGGPRETGDVVAARPRLGGRPGDLESEERDSGAPNLLERLLSFLGRGGLGDVDRETERRRVLRQMCRSGEEEREKERGHASIVYARIKSPR